LRRAFPMVPSLTSRLRLPRRAMTASPKVSRMPASHLARTDAT
jgi:hypothetical protein